MKYIPTIGLEIHAELKTKSKMFCPCLNDPLEQQPNANICPVCMGHPGTLPVANEEAIQTVLKAGLALGCHIPEKSKFDRKNYFYPDLPKGYQISQYDMPLCQKGELEIGERTIGITRVHLEEDTGKLVHPEGADYSLIDFNRAGIPLMELVTEPDITSAKEARLFAQELQLILRYLGASDADMEKGQMRVEANISVRPEGHEKLGTKVEVKNLNSFRAVEGAIDFEIKRQVSALESGETISQETRGWDDVKQETFVQREKEAAHDYRYFPEPDLPPMEFASESIESLRAELPELPQTRREELQGYNLPEKDIEVLVNNKELGDYFKRVNEKIGMNPPSRYQQILQLVANYIINTPLDPQKLPEPEDFLVIMGKIVDEGISSAIAKKMLNELIATGKVPLITQIADESQIEKIAKDIIEKNPKAVGDYKKGKANALQFLVGQMMAATKGTVSPDLARKVLEVLLTETSRNVRR